MSILNPYCFYNGINSNNILDKKGILLDEKKNPEKIK